MGCAEEEVQIRIHTDIEQEVRRPIVTQRRNQDKLEAVQIQPLVKRINNQNMGAERMSEQMHMSKQAGEGEGEGEKSIEKLVGIQIKQLIEQESEWRQEESRGNKQFQFKVIDQDTFLANQQILNIRPEQQIEVKEIKESDPNLWLEMIRHDQDLTMFYAGFKKEILARINQTNRQRQLQRKEQLINEMIEKNKCHFEVTQDYYRLRDHVFAQQ